MGYGLSFGQEVNLEYIRIQNLTGILFRCPKFCGWYGW
jgi:hypothetical protein